MYADCWSPLAALDVIDLVTRIKDVEWNLFDVKAINHVNDMHLPVATLKVAYDDQVEKQAKSIAFSMNAEQIAVLLAGRISCCLSYIC